MDISYTVDLINTIDEIKDNGPLMYQIEVQCLRAFIYGKYINLLRLSLDCYRYLPREILRSSCAV